MTELTTSDIVVKRVFDAPVESIWKIWTDAELVQQWWGPKDYTSPSCQIDLREGGKYLFCMHAPDYQGGMDYYSSGIYQKIVPLTLLEFTQYLADKDGNAIEPSQVGMPSDFPKIVNISISFKAINDHTSEIVVTEYAWPVGQMREMSRLGMEQSLDKIAEALSQ